MVHLFDESLGAVGGGFLEVVADEREEGTPRADQWLRNPSSFTAADMEVFRGSGVKTLALGRGGANYEEHLKFMAEWNGLIASRPEWFVRVDDVDDLKSTRRDGRIGWSWRRRAGAC